MYMMNYIQNFKNWTNVCFLLPLGLAVYYGLPIYGAVLFLVVFSSFVYHSTGHYIFKTLDYVSAYLLILANLYYAWKGNFDYATVAMMLFFIAFSLYFKFKKVRNERDYIYNHGYWHIISSFITVFVLVTFLLG